MNKFKMLILLTVSVLLTGCGLKEKEPIDDEIFNKIMTNEGFKVVDVEQQFEQYGYFEDSYVATNNNYQIEFYELENDRYAIEFYNTNKNIFENQKGGTYVDSHIDLDKVNKYTLTTDKEYKVISRIEDTVVYLNVDKKYKEEVNNILGKLGY